MKKKLILPLLILFSLISSHLNAQTVDIYRDSVVQLYGVVMTADSLKAIPLASIVVNNKVEVPSLITMVFFLSLSIKGKPSLSVVLALKTEKLSFQQI